MIENYYLIKCSQSIVCKAFFKDLRQSRIVIDISLSLLINLFLLITETRSFVRLSGIILLLRIFITTKNKGFVLTK